MKLIYTCIYNDSWNKGLDNPKALKVLRKSVQQSNRWYETEIYCDSISYNTIKTLNIPFNNIIILNELDNYSSTNWGITKLITIKNQNQPHIHIDMDTILLKPLEIDTSYDVIWGNAEASLLYGKGHYSSFKYINDHYIKMSEKYEPKLLEDGYFDFSHVPNNSLLIINNPELTSKIIKELEERIKPYFRIKCGSINMFMEQFLFMNMMRESGGNVNYMPRRGEFHISDYNKHLIINNEIPFSDFEENGWIHFEHFNKYDMNEVNWILNQIK